MNALEMEYIDIEREHMKYLVLGVMKLCFLVRHDDPDLTLNPWKKLSLVLESCYKDNTRQCFLAGTQYLWWRNAFQKGLTVQL